MITPEQIDRALDLVERIVAAIEFEMSVPIEADDTPGDFEIAFIPDGPLDS